MECEMGKARSFILKSRQGNFKSNVWSSTKLVFSFMDVLLIFLKYLRSVLFPGIVIYAFAGFVIYLCQDLSCLWTGTMFSISVFERSILPGASNRTKTCLNVYFSRLYLGVLIIYIISSVFFLLREIVLSYTNF